jgi:hypothetical protein
MSEDTKLALPGITKPLKDMYGDTPSYSRLWMAAASGRIPAERLPTGRWLVRVADLPAIAEHFGLIEPQQPAA